MTEDTNALPPSDARFVLRALLVLAWLIPTAVYGLFVLFAPRDVLTQVRSLSRLCDFLDAFASARLTPIDLFAHARATAFSQVARGATAIAMLLWPVSVLGTFFANLLVQTRVRQRLAKLYSFKHGLAVAFVMPVCVMFGPGFFALHGDPSFARGLTTDGRVGFLVMSFFGLGLSAVLAGTWPIFVLALGKMPFARPSAGTPTKHVI